MARILVIDDDELLRPLFAEMLTDAGHSVSSAGDGATAVVLARETLPDLILCDVVMSGLDGYGVLTALRQDPLTAIIPVIFLTGVGGSAAQRKGMELGADDYLTKPIREQDLVRAVEARLARRVEARQEVRRRLDSLKASIAGSLPHEFLTPLTAVMGLSSLLMDEGETFAPEAIQEVGRGIFLGGQRLQEIISKFLLHAELQATPEVGAYPPGVANAAAFVEEVVRAKAVRLDRQADLEVHAEDLTVPLPKDHLRPLLEELVENACLFSIPKTPVVVRCWRGEEGHCLIGVSDRGRGMSAEQVQGLGAYVPTRRHEQEPGFGLGLAIVHRLVQLYGGRMSFETAPGQGTTVLVDLPSGRP